MSVTAERKAQIIKEFATVEGDTGSPEVQVAILTERINNLTNTSRTTRRTITPDVASSRWFPAGGRSSTI